MQDDAESAQEAVNDGADSHLQRVLASFPSGCSLTYYLKYARNRTFGQPNEGVSCSKPVSTWLASSPKIPLKSDLFAKI